MVTKVSVGKSQSSSWVLECHVTQLRETRGRQTYQGVRTESIANVKGPYDYSIRQFTRSQTRGTTKED